MDNASPYRVIDYVQLRGPDSSRDISAEILQVMIPMAFGIPLATMSMPGPPELGNKSQTLKHTLPISGRGRIPKQSLLTNCQTVFLVFFNGAGIIACLSWRMVPDPTKWVLLYNQCHASALQPTRLVVQYITWQANDPLVHYVASDLNYLGESSGSLQPGKMYLTSPSQFVDRPETWPIE